jgi:uncharacterized protein (TIGR02466 family)
MSGPPEERPAAEGGKIDAKVLKLFATPVILAQLPDCGALNRDLLQAIRAKMAEDPGTQHSNLGGWQSSWDMEAWGGPGVEHLLAVARQLAGQMTRDRQGQPVQVAWKVNCWANVNRSGHGNEFHTHPGSFWSGAYYVDDGGVADDPALGGAFEAQDPRGVGPAMYAPLLAFPGPDGAAVGASQTIQPRSGMMMLFPSWLSHAVRPYGGTRERISIAFNLSV